MRAAGKDLAEIFGYAPDDTTDAARKQWKSQNCPFTNSGCVKHGHAQAGATPEVYGSCSVLNKNKNTATKFDFFSGYILDSIGKGLEKVV